jgi:DNA-directed RNA polymerase specialized sigma24 family protein
MEVKINYEGKEIWVDEQVKECLDELKREESVQSRKSRRHELLWDSMLIDGIENDQGTLPEIVPIEEDVIWTMYLQTLDKLINGLESTDKQIITDRFFNKMKYREMAEKYAMPVTSIQYRIEKSIKKMSRKFNDVLNKL